jgi:ATP synthase protein I
MAVAIFGCFFLGNWLDSKLGTEPYFTFGLLIIGILAGFRNMYLLIKGYIKNTKPTTREESELHGKRPPPKET